MAAAVRGHWQIENGLHYMLDVSMEEDACRLRKDNGAENFSRLRRITLNKLRPIVVRNARDCYPARLLRLANQLQIGIPILHHAPVQPFLNIWDRP